MSLPKTMKAWGQSLWGRSKEFLRVIEVPVPELRSGDVLVHVRAVATNPVDLKVRDGPAGTTAGDAIDGGVPKVVGWDAAGVVASVGENAKHFQVGDEVYFAGDVTRAGCFSEYVAVDERAVAHKPRSVDWSEAAAIPLTALTAYEGLVEVMRIKDGRDLSLLVVGGAGGVGSIVSQLAKRVLRFDTVISTASRPETIAFCLEQGADKTISHREDLKAQLEEIGFPQGVDVVFNATEADGNWDAVTKVIKPLGQLLLITGMHKEVNLTEVMFPRVSVHWEFMFSRLMFNDQPEKQGEILTKFASWVDKGVISPRVTDGHRFAIADMPTAADLQNSGKAIGKIVLDCSEWPPVQEE